MTAGLTLRLARAAAFAVVCAGLGLAAHLAGGGAVAGPVLAGGLAVAFLVALPATGRERGPGVILGLLTGLQVALHLLFATAREPRPPAAIGVHVHASGLVPDLGMLIMHCWAVGLTALWLARGEAMLWAILRRLMTRLFARMLPPGPAGFPPVERRAASGALDMPRPVPPRHISSGRAPPAALPTGLA
ncbi:hypothetical protein Acor_81710 [Acrocarpospora corrugata]|uniref:Uncharacterized protein n=1 Tax=Acrocarpospora corrugata TaxID=35763 RepID=A0A5M3WDE7_9ACTN|nr:MFS transporter [Acrocarpospora corrugata]GES06102.1 hypothetical protein Acor_81710 [Acrocarpospora corrugata]